MTLYLKYRPSSIAEVIGQNHIKTILNNAFSQNKISHAYLFSGPRGTGKTTIARIVAKEVACNTEELRNQALKGQCVDIIEIDAASNRGIEEIRDLRDKIMFAPVQAKAKVYIIDEVHMLTKEAFNALLKTLEEPPSHAYFILATTEINKVPDTIISRCQHFQFTRINVEDIVGRLKEISEKEKINYEEEALKLIAISSAGGMRNAISSLEQIISSGNITVNYVKEVLGLNEQSLVISFVDLLIAGESKNLLEKTQELVDDGGDLYQFIRELLLELQKRMHLQIEKKEYPKRVLEIIEYLQISLQETKGALIPQLPLEIACIKLSQENLNTESSSSGFFDVLGFNKKKDIEKTETNKKTEEKTIQKNKEELEKIDLSLENLKEYWYLVLDKIETSTIKTAAKSIKIEDLKDNKIYFSVSTDFYRQTLEKSKGFLELQKALIEVFGGKIDFEITTKKTPDLNLSEKKEEKKEEDLRLDDLASEVFGIE
jgi:DNA polymerase-3 subunit gamma/tau